MIGDVAFRTPSTKVRSPARAWILIVYFLGLGAWSVEASWHPHRLLGLAAALVLLELGLLMIRSVQMVGGFTADEDVATRIAVPLLQLCALAGCSAPRVTIPSRTGRGASVRAGRDGTPLLVVSRPLVDRLDDLELRAILAHEISHIVTGDLKRARLRVRLPAVVLCIGLLAAIVLTSGDDVAFPIYISGYFVVFIAAMVALSPLQRPLELRADAGAVRLTLEGEHLVSALEKLTSLSEDSRRQVMSGPWRWLLLPFAWKVPSHPSMQVRTSRIRAISTSIARPG
jgi:Zn-dependent protease with chaperone function